MFAEFSRGYYLGRLYVAPHDGDRAVMQRELHEQVNEQLYADEGLARLDAPLVMKLDNRHFMVHGSPDVPGGTLEVPEHVLEDVDVENPPTLQEILLAKADRAQQLLELSGQVDGQPGI
ncbi:hypothetical protein BRC81_09845 [Halobacteriales archaeon QS_1_68_20]|nr:MAG: hypothetical protein BRC81_09845 [Halobacteriales archaeon QS_1_68_20]